MMADSTATPRDRHRPPFPFGELARVLLIPLVAVGAFVLINLVSRQHERGGVEEDGLRRIALVEKDADWRPVPRDKGGASGAVWYTPAAPELSFRLEAEGLVPRKRYLIELAVDDDIYTVASRGADRAGELAIDTTLTQFAEGVCVGTNYDPPRPLAGRHELRFWVKTDGSPRSGTDREHAPQSAGGRDLPCSGNGDGDYTYVLHEKDVATYVGRPSTAKSSEDGMSAS